MTERSRRTPILRQSRSLDSDLYVFGVILSEASAGFFDPPLLRVGGRAVEGPAVAVEGRFRCSQTAGPSAPAKAVGRDDNKKILDSTIS